jgi:aspartate-semialdehyde dehydrogenase
VLNIVILREPGFLTLFENKKNLMSMKIALVGATGLVGTVMIKVLEEMNFPCTAFIPAASERSVGKEVLFHGRPHKIVSLQDAVNARPAIAIFSAGGSVQNNGRKSSRQTVALSSTTPRPGA